MDRQIESRWIFEDRTIPRYCYYYDVPPKRVMTIMYRDCGRRCDGDRAASYCRPIGIGLMTYGFGSFFQLLPGSDISSLLLIYGFPILLLGFALSYAQLEPVPCVSTPEALALRESQATDIQNQVGSVDHRTIAT